MIKVAYSGETGAYAEIAAKNLFDRCITIPHIGFSNAYRAVHNGECDYAVLPIENSYAGDVSPVIDLAFSGDLHIINIYEMSIRHRLLGLPTAQEQDIRRVISHPQALWQCMGYIERRKLATTESVSTASGAASVASLCDKSVAAIASREAAEKYGLVVLSENINESMNNSTRFALFSKQQNNYDTPRRFIMFFTVRNEAGSLGRAVSVIGEYAFNLRALKSHPTKINNWEYYFYVEGDGNIDSRRGKEMINKLKQLCLSVKVVGKFNVNKGMQI